MKKSRKDERLKRKEKNEGGKEKKWRRKNMKIQK